MWKIIKKLLGKKEKELSYPHEFAFIVYTPEAIEDGVQDNQNKIIVHNFINEYGNPETKQYPYSEEKADNLKKMFNIPIYDTTTEKIKFPIYSTISPQEVRFKSR